MKCLPLFALVCCVIPLLVTTPALAQQTHITSQVQLQQYLQVTPPGASPLDQLSPGGRKRFLAQLRFGARSLGGFSTDDLVNELTHDQISAVLQLFDAQQYASGLDGLLPAQRAQRQREREADAKSRGCATIATCPESDIELRYDRLVLQEPDRGLPQSERKARIAQHYDQLFMDLQSPKRLQVVSKPDLRLLERAAAHVTSFTPDASHIDGLRTTLAEMQRRGMAEDADFTDLYRALIANRQFGDAAALADRHPGMDVARAPTLRASVSLPPDPPTVLVLDTSGASMTRQAIDLSVPLRIVVVASCHFSQDAARAIHADAEVGPLFARHAIWLADQGESFAAMRDWNRQFPAQPMHMAWRNAEWSMLDSWAMPTFYVFRHGKLVDQWSGWLADSGMQTLRTHLRKVGVLGDTPAAR